VICLRKIGDRKKNNNINHDKLSKACNKQKPLNKWFLSLVIIFVLSYYISNNWYQLMLIQGNSMSPVYHNLQMVVLDRHSKDYTYGDVIAFRCKGLDAVLVKRIAACPGDIVVIEQGTLYVNGEISVVYFDKGIFEYAGNLGKTVQLEEGQYIVIGDNIASSKDSRYTKVGCVLENDILGTIIR